ncbi:MAG TPA: M20/M25/M40 family metallo-hydrolase [Pirellulales bacterium]|jgi:tripeptide aminopeptidase|nr:M20/M25/M40 family metallo-hydrolase [Pirellulales bacterium]
MAEKSQVRRSRKRRAPAGKASKQKPTGASAAGQQVATDEGLRLVMQMMSLPGLSGHEGLVAQFIMDQLRHAGAPETAIQLDTAHQRTPIAGEVGNLILKLPGTFKAPRRLLMAHMDTVPICLGCKPLIEKGFVRSADAKTGLGADDRAGATAILCAALAILRYNLPHPPLTFFWPIQEEVGLYGARHADVKLLGQPKLAFNWDGGTPEKVTLGATGGYRMQIQIEGLASHAGSAPELGVSAIAIAALAISRLHQEGWHGKIVKGKQSGTSNVGVIQGGAATNVVTEQVQLKAEARSHNPKFRQQIVRAIESAFTDAAKQVRSAQGARGKVTFEGHLDYESFQLDDGEACVAVAEAALRDMGLNPVRAISNGGLDANWMHVHGIPTVTLGCGQMNAHTTSERLDIAAFHQACEIALRLATATENTEGGE